MKVRIISLFAACLMVIGAQGQVDRSKQPQPGPAPKINLEKPISFEMDNGLEVMVVEDHTLPKVTTQLMIDNKPHSEAKPGTSTLLSMMLGTGTEKIGKDAYNEEIDFLGASINFGAESATANSLSKYFPRVLELMAAGALHPKFTQEEFDAQKAKLIESLKFDDKSVPSIASRLSGVLAYGANHPYGEFATPESVEKITLQDIKSYYNNYFVPKNAYLVVVGDITSNEVKKLVKNNFKKWEEATPPEASLPPVKPAQYTQIDFVDMPNAVQSEIRVQNTVDLQMSDEDYFPVLIANQILGGSFGSYLNMNLREKHGFTYGARSRVGTDKYASRFSASTSVRNAVTDSSVVEILKEIKRIRNEKVFTQDLNLAKNKYAGNFVLMLERPSTIADLALNIKTKDLDEDFYSNYLKNIQAVTQEDVMRVANKYFKTGNLQIIVAGKGSEILEGLENISFNGKTVPVFYFDKMGNKVDRPVFEKPIPEGVTVETVFNNYIDAIGGKEAVKAVNSIYILGETEMQGMTLNIAIKETNTKSATEVLLNGNSLQKEVFNGETGYRMAQGQKMEYTAEEIADKKDNGGLFPELTKTDATLEKIGKFNGEDAYVVKMDENTTAYYDTDTGLKIGTETTKENMGRTITQTTGFSNYKEVKGVKIPHTMTVSFGPQKQKLNVVEVKINEGVSDADFQ